MAKKIAHLKQLGWDKEWQKAGEGFNAKGWVPGRVLSEHRATYLVSAEDHDYTAKVSGRFRFEAGGRAGYPVVGDWVLLQTIPEIREALIQAVLPRRSKLSRKVKMEETREHLLAANIDGVIIVQALDETFNLRRLERYLVVAKENYLEAIVVLNKVDLCETVVTYKKKSQTVCQGAPVLPVCSLNLKGYPALKKVLLPGKTYLLLGTSGVGKSTIVNNLAGEDYQAIYEVRETDSKGRHMTTSRELYLLHNGVMLLDSPGLRELQLWEGDAGLKDVFTDVEELTASCKFLDCRHESEPGCAVRAAVAEGVLSEERYLSYVKLKRELAYLDTRKSEKSWREKKAKDRRATKDFNRKVDLKYLE